MKAAWDDISDRLADVEKQLLQSDLKQEVRLELQKKHAQLSHRHSIHAALNTVLSEIVSLQDQLVQVKDQEMLVLIQDELEALAIQKQERETALEELLYPADEQDKRSVYLEIRGGTGGQEAALFAADLLKMYWNYAEKKGWKASIQSFSQTDLGGVREAVLHIKGKGVYGHLKHESGVHRVQRVPKTETSGRVHTSTATIAVLPEADAVDLSIDPSDLRIDVFRASGAGGQHVNTTDSAVRITHIPSGVVVSCQDERSQHKNKAKALKELQSRLIMATQQKQHQEMSSVRKQQVGSGMRSEKVRTYNFPQNRVTDHQVGLTLKKLDIVMEGELDEIVQALRCKEREQRRASHT